MVCPALSVVIALAVVAAGQLPSQDTGKGKGWRSAILLSTRYHLFSAVFSLLLAHPNIPGVVSRITLE